MVGKRRKRIVTYLAWAFLPMIMVPFLAFGLFALQAHRQSLETEILAKQRTSIDGMRKSLDSLVEIVRTQFALLPTPQSPQDLEDKVRQSVIHWRALASAITRVYWLDAQGTVRFTEPAYPAAYGLPLAEMDSKIFNDEDGSIRFNAVYTNDLGVPHFQMVRRVRSPSYLGYFAVEVSLDEWFQVVSHMHAGLEEVLAALVPYGVDRTKGNSINLSQNPNSDFWFKIQEIRSNPLTSRMIELSGGSYYVAVDDVAFLQSRLILAHPASESLGSVRKVAVWFVATAILLLSALFVSIVGGARWLERPLRRMTKATDALALGDFDSRVATSGPRELHEFAQSFNAMGDALRVAQRRMRVQHKSILELSACQDADGLLRKLVELACTQCLGDVAWFEPLNFGHAVEFADQRLFVGLHGWAWKQHRSLELGPSEVDAVWKRSDGDRVFGFTVRNQTEELGTLKVGYRQIPDESSVLLLHSLVSLAEMAIQRQEIIRQGAMVATELELASTVQRNVVSDDLVVTQSARIAYHYQPAMRLGGDWFFLIEDQVQDRLHIIMGDVAGHGLAQGVVTTAVKGALEVLEQLIKSQVGVTIGPAAIVGYLDRVIQRVASKNHLTMTCLAAEVDFAALKLRVCNAGHTFPIMVGGEGENVVRHLHKNQQPMLGSKGVTHTYVEADYDLLRDDLLVIYTDGMSEAKNLKSHIFGRFLMRSLRKKSDYGNAEELRDDILHMFQYYTQGKQVDDDVCFLVVQIGPSREPSERPMLRPA